MGIKKKNQMIKHSDYLESKKNFITEKGLMSPEMYEFYMKIYRAQEDFMLKCSSLPEDYRKFKLEVLPALSVNDIVIDDGTKHLLNELLGKLADIIAEVNSGLNFSGLSGSFINDADPFLHALLSRDNSYLEKEALKNRLDLDEFIFVLHNVFKPFLIRLRECFQVKMDREDWLKGSCPVCGYLPDMSKIVESRDNQRHLHCSLCENGWEFPRLVCPVCGCEEQSKHGYFEYEDDPSYRVYYCDECKHYIKNVRVPKLKEESKFDLAVEDVITSFLDASMMEKGYKRI